MKARTSRTLVSHIRAGLVLLLLGFVLVRVSQPYMQSHQFQELVRREVEQARPVGDLGRLHTRILEHARSMRLEITPGDVQVERLGKGCYVRVRYAAPLDLRVYRTSLRFSLEATQATSYLD